eukprot:scaffold26281_cov87-Amphora_coffeaeformis.AAC.1
MLMLRRKHHLGSRISSDDSSVYRTDGTFWHPTAVPGDWGGSTPEPGQPHNVRRKDAPAARIRRLAVAVAL